MGKKKIVFFTGAGIDKESGVNTFRDSGGLWEGHDIMEVATPEGWRRNRELVLDFYNKRRQQLHTIEPNQAHKLIAELEKDYEVVVVTQNVTNLHERAGSTNVIHLHGEMLKACSSRNKELTVPWTGDINIGDKHEDGSQLRPYIVWFGEDVPNIIKATKEVMGADILVVIGSSLQVYPAADLLNYIKEEGEFYYIDPSPILNKTFSNSTTIPKVATEGMEDLLKLLKDK